METEKINWPLDSGRADSVQSNTPRTGYRPPIVETINPAGETIGETMTTTKTAFQTVAGELVASFERASRGDCQRFWRFKADAAPWIESAELARAAHEAVDGDDPRFPCDWIYSLMAGAAEWLADSGHETADAAGDSIQDFADEAADIGTAGLFAWAAAHGHNRALADEFFADRFDAGTAMAGGFELGAVAALRGGQCLGAERVAAAIVDAVEAEAAKRSA